METTFIIFFFFFDILLFYSYLVCHLLVFFLFIFIVKSYSHYRIKIKYFSQLIDFLQSKRWRELFLYRVIQNIWDPDESFLSFRILLVIFGSISIVKVKTLQLNNSKSRKIEKNPEKFWRSCKNTTVWNTMYTLKKKFTSKKLSVQIFSALKILTQRKIYQGDIDRSSMLYYRWIFFCFLTATRLVHHNRQSLATAQCPWKRRVDVLFSNGTVTRFLFSSLTSLLSKTNSSCICASYPPRFFPYLDENWNVPEVWFALEDNSDVTSPLCNPWCEQKDR